MKFLQDLVPGCSKVGAVQRISYVPMLYLQLCGLCFVCYSILVDFQVTGKAVMLDEIINYVQSLQRQVEVRGFKDCIFHLLFPTFYVFVNVCFFFYLICVLYSHNCLKFSWTCFNCFVRFLSCIFRALISEMAPLNRFTMVKILGHFDIVDVKYLLHGH